MRGAGGACADQTAGVSALLNEKDTKLQALALQKLDTLVDRFWAELADSVPRIEELYEDESFPERKLAALVASKVYFYLGELDDALSFALGADNLFDVEVRSEYIETVVSKAIDEYIAQRNAPPAERSVDARLEAIVDKMQQRCLSDRAYHQALGVALEAGRLDTVQRVFEETRDQTLLTYVLEVVMGAVASPALRSEVLHLLVKLFQSLPSPDYFSIAQCYVYLNEPQAASQLLFSLLEAAAGQGEDGGEPLLVAYQIAFDLVESATQEFLTHLRGDLERRTGGGEAKAQESGARDAGLPAWSARIRQILTGEESIQLYRDFLKSANHADLAILKGSKDLLDAHYSAYHSAMSLSNAFMNAGTTSDQFLRENLDWLAKASNWSKFTATAALGVLNKGNLKEGLNILRPYLPSDGPSSSVYSEGGSLFALGLIHANHGAEVLGLLTNMLRTNTAEVVQHGAALGLGAAGMATENEEVYEELRTVLYSDSAVAGEAAGYAMGLVYLGTGSERATEEMVQYAQETQHEKIIRGLAVGIALLNYGRESNAEATIEVLLSNRDAIIRYGGVYAIALAYAGTGNNRAISRLLHIAVSDGSDDVRRAAVTALGFLLLRNPAQVPQIVQLLSESYNPHVRYGSALALGIACAGTGLDAAVDLLEPLTKDPVDFVRQGACIALGMIFIEQNDTLNPRVQAGRKTFDRILSEKHEEAMAKFGAALAQGLIDAGGRNVTITLQGRGGSNKTAAIVGMALFAQYWYWFPMAHFASLAFTPTAVIGLTRELEAPELQLVSRARPSLFAYPPPVPVASERKLEKVETAVLSTTAKSQARQRTKERKKAAQEGGEAMDTDDAPPASKDDAPPAEEKPADAAPKKGPEPSSETLPNCSRVTPFQLKYVAFAADSRFVPVRAIGARRTDAWSAAEGDALPALAAPPRADGEKDGAAPSADAAHARRLAGFTPAGGGGIVLLRDREPGKPFARVNMRGDAQADGERRDGDQVAAVANAPDQDAEDKGPTGVDAAREQPPPAGEDVDMDTGAEAR